MAKVYRCDNKDCQSVSKDKWPETWMVIKIKIEPICDPEYTSSIGREFTLPRESNKVHVCSMDCALSAISNVVSSMYKSITNEIRTKTEIYNSRNK